MDKYLQIIASASLFRGIAKTEIAAVLQNLDAQLRVYPRNSFIWQLGEQVTAAAPGTKDCTKMIVPDNTTTIQIPLM